MRRLAPVIGLIWWVAPVAASPVSYDFTGTLSQPLYGATTFTGTLTYDTDLPAESQSPNYNIYSGVPLNSSEPVLSLNFTIGGVSSSAYGDVVNDNLSVSHATSVTPPTPSTDQFEIWEQFNNAMSAELILSNNNLVSRSPFTSVQPPASLNLSSFNLGGTLGISGYYNGQLVDELGTITSLTPVTTTSDPGTGGRDDRHGVELVRPRDGPRANVAHRLRRHWSGRGLYTARVTPPRCRGKSMRRPSRIQ